MVGRDRTHERGYRFRFEPGGSWVTHDDAAYVTRRPLRPLAARDERGLVVEAQAVTGPSEPAGARVSAEVV